MEVTTPKQFGEAIRRRRKEAKLTQEDLALAMGATRRLVSELEQGTRATSLEMALRAAAELGIDVRLEPRR